MKAVCPAGDWGGFGSGSTWSPRRAGTKKPVALQEIQDDTGRENDGVVSAEVPNQELVIVNDEGEAVVEPGRFRLTVGGASPGARAVALGAPKPAEAVVTVE